MADRALTGTPFENPICATPSAGDATTLGDTSGVKWNADMPGGTANMSELPACSGVQMQNFPDAPGVGEAVKVWPGVTSPAEVAGNIDAGGSGSGVKR